MPEAAVPQRGKKHPNINNGSSVGFRKIAGETVGFLCRRGERERHPRVQQKQNKNNSCEKIKVPRRTGRAKEQIILSVAPSENGADRKNRNGIIPRSACV